MYNAPMEKKLLHQIKRLLTRYREDELAVELDVSKRTIQNWQKDPSGMTVKKITRLERLFAHHFRRGGKPQC